VNLGPELYIKCCKIKKINDTSRRRLAHLQDHFDGEDAREHVVEIVEDEVAERMLKDGVFSGQRYTARTDDDHDEQVEVTKIDDEVTEPTNAAQTYQHHTIVQHSIDRRRRRVIYASPRICSLGCSAVVSPIRYL